MQKTAVFRADASPKIGGGHVMRCLALADGLMQAGWLCRFWVSPGTLATVPALVRSGHKFLDHGPPKEQVQLLIVDHYDLDIAFEASCRSWARHILVIDDLANRRHDCDLLLDQTLGRSAKDYGELTPFGCELLLGPDHALLRPDFSRYRNKSLMRRHGAIKRILLTFGSSDPWDMTGVALDGLEHAGVDAFVDVVLGRSSPNSEAIANRLQGWERAQFHADASNMAELMSSADISIGAAGVTSWERCTVGLPGLVVVTADNQRIIARTLDPAGAAVFLGDWTTMTSSRLVDALRAMGEPRRMLAMADAAASVCDGLGVLRTVAKLEKLQ